MRRENKKESRENKKVISWIFLFFIVLLTAGLVFALPDKPSIISVSNSTYSNPNNGFINISGGYISKVNLTANFQNTRWKAFVGNVTGKFTLSDVGGFTIFDWTLATTTGRVYSTRSSGAITWGNINCSNSTFLNQENIDLFFNISSDNITNTFNNVTHSAFFAAGRFISANTCPTLNTYKNNATQEADFEEMLMHDGTNSVYATIMENDVAGYDGNLYDFQMIIPENASSSWAASLAYYLYVELD